MWSQMSMKFSYDQLRTDKALRNWKPDNKNKKKNKNKTFVALVDPFRVKTSVSVIGLSTDSFLVRSELL